MRALSVFVAACALIAAVLCYQFLRLNAFILFVILLATALISHEIGKREGSRQKAPRPATAPPVSDAAPRSTGS